MSERKKPSKKKKPTAKEKKQREEKKQITQQKRARKKVIDVQTKYEQKRNRLQVEYNADIQRIASETNMSPYELEGFLTQNIVGNERKGTPGNTLRTPGNTLQSNQTGLGGKLAQGTLIDDANTKQANAKFIEQTDEDKELEKLVEDFDAYLEDEINNPARVQHLSNKEARYLISKNFLPSIRNRDTSGNADKYGYNQVELIQDAHANATQDRVKLWTIY